MLDKRALRAELRYAIAGVLAAAPSERELDQIVLDLATLARGRPLGGDDWLSAVERHCPGANTPGAVESSYLDHLLEELLAAT
jgi:hypothetical protein